MVAIWLRVMVLFLALAAYVRASICLLHNAPEAAVRWGAVGLVMVIVSVPRRRRRPRAPRPGAPRAAGLASSQRVVE